MPFKTGLGTADFNLPVRTCNGILTRFQCPLRRAWVLRLTACATVTATLTVSMPFKTGLGTAGGWCDLRMGICHIRFNAL